MTSQRMGMGKTFSIIRINQNITHHTHALKRLHGIIKIKHSNEYNSNALNTG